jgi:hypothetical protein
MRYLVHNTVPIGAQNRHPVCVHRVMCVLGAAQLVTVPQSSTRAAYQAMLPHATDWHPGNSVGAGCLRSVGGIRPAQTEMNPARVDPRESMQKTGRGWVGAGGYKEGSRGAVLVPKTYGWDTLAATVVRRSQTAHCSHLRSRVSVGLEAPKGNQGGSRAGRRAEQTFRSHVTDPP